jgi:ABC-type sugar transport system permease subunit
MAGPGLVVYGALIIVPLFMAIGASLTDWRGFGSDAAFVGLGNYEAAIADERVARTLLVTAAIALGSTAVMSTVGLLLARTLNYSGRAAIVYRALIFYPMILSPVAAGFLFRSLLSYRGAVNEALVGVGVGRIDFLADPDMAVAVITGVVVWQTIGFATILFLAGLQGVPSDLVDAAQVDGANSLQVFRHVTLPAIAPAITVTVVTLLILGMREYDRVAVLTDGGPARMTETVPFTIIKEAFTYSRVGYAAAISMVLLVVVAVGSGLVLARLRRYAGRAL